MGNMELPIPKVVKKLWDVWNLRGSILSSLTLQVFLLLFASRRQRSKSSLLLICIWLSYLLSDWVAAVAIGLITKSQGGSCDYKGNHDLLAFWASFLLLHLGGPDSITSFALEDNQFWLRHLIGLVLQVLLAFYSLFLTIPNNKLLAPTILVFVVGTVKFAERTSALYLASSDHFAETVLPPPNPGPDYEEAVQIYSSMRSVQIETPLEKRTMPNVVNYDSREDKSTGKENEKMSLEEEIKLLDEAYSNFETFKGLIVGFILSSRYRESSRKSFLRRLPDQAFRLIEYELCFMYHVLHTKVVVVRRKIGYILRFISFFSIIAVSVTFYFVNKRGFNDCDIGITYALLAGAISVECISVFNLIFSVWSLIAPNKNMWTEAIAKRTLKDGKWSGWSGWVSQYNMISYCQDERPKCLYNLASCLYMKAILDQIKIWCYSSSETVTRELKSFIFTELRAKSQTASTLRAAMEACSQRGDWALLRRASSYESLKWSVGEFQFAESLLLWHLATELCYSQAMTSHKEATESMRICKVISDYMFCLLVSKPAMLAPVLGNWHIVFQDTCAEAKRFFSKHGLWQHSTACEKILQTTTQYRPAAVKGNKSKSVLFDANILAEQLRSVENQWKLMSRVWVELLSYAAINCRPIVHAQQLGKGGELLTFTWLLMCHLGFGTQFYEQEQHAGKKMVATK